MLLYFEKYYSTTMALLFPLLLAAPSVLGYVYPAIPTDKTTPTQQRISIAGPNGEWMLRGVIEQYALT